jgi:hypothetical protein
MGNDCVLWEMVAAGVFDSRVRLQESWKRYAKRDYLAAGSSGRLGWFGGSSPGDDRDICRPSFGREAEHTTRLVCPWSRRERPPGLGWGLSP